VPSPVQSRFRTSVRKISPKRFSSKELFENQTAHNLNQYSYYVNTSKSITYIILAMRRGRRSRRGRRRGSRRVRRVLVSRGGVRL